MIAAYFGVKFFLNKEQPIEREFYVVEESHYYLKDSISDDTQGSMLYFTNDEDFHLVVPGMMVFIYNEEKTMRFMVDDVYEKDVHGEYKDGQLFYGRRVYFTLPHTNLTYTMDKMYIEFSTLFDGTYIFNAGSLHVEFKEELPFYKYRSLEGTKKELEPTLDEILVGIWDKGEIDHIYVGPYEAPYYIKDNIIHIVMPEEIHMLSQTFVLFEVEGKTFHISNFKYFWNYEILTFGIYTKYEI
ncbi:hypothetical protein [Acholeplasma hippikon]|nr:hypothetical protein [Acholeplasma hippikon]